MEMDTWQMETAESGILNGNDIGGNCCPNFGIGIFGSIFGFG